MKAKNKFLLNIEYGIYVALFLLVIFSVPDLVLDRIGLADSFFRDSVAISMFVFLTVLLVYPSNFTKVGRFVKQFFIAVFLTLLIAVIPRCIMYFLRG